MCKKKEGYFLSVVSLHHHLHPLQHHFPISSFSLGWHSFLQIQARRNRGKTRRPEWKEKVRSKRGKILTLVVSQVIANMFPFFLSAADKRKEKKSGHQDIDPKGNVWLFGNPFKPFQTLGCFGDLNFDILIWIWIEKIYVVEDSRTSCFLNNEVNLR